MRSIGTDERIFELFGTYPSHLRRSCETVVDTKGAANEKTCNEGNAQCCHDVVSEIEAKSELKEGKERI